MKKLLTEGIGTFFLTLIFVVAANNGAGEWAPLAVAAALTALTFASRELSGGHLNPAISLAVWMRGGLEKREIAPMMAAQIVGAGLASLIGVFLLGSLGRAQDIAPGNHDLFGALTGEFFGAFALAWVFLNATARPSNSFFGLAVGFVFLAVSVALGPLSGGFFNPAVGLGATLAGMANFADCWVFLVGPFLGAAAAATVFQIVNGRED